MTDELGVEVAVVETGGCPVAEASATAGAPVSEVSRASTTDAAGRVAEEFAMPSGARPAVASPSAAPPDGDGTAADEPGEGAQVDRDAMARVASYDDHDVYRFRREQGPHCVCETVDALGYPVRDISAVDGTLVVGFHAPDVETVRAVIERLRERFGGVSLRSLTRVGERDGEDLVLVDRAHLTDRQREVLETAHELGYFEHPKGANGGEVAAALDISPSTFSEHLAAAQRKVLDAVLER